MKKKILFSKDELLQKAKELKKQESEYNKIVQQKPNVKRDGIEPIVDWIKDLLLVMKK